MSLSADKSTTVGKGCAFQSQNSDKLTPETCGTSNRTKAFIDNVKQLLIHNEQKKGNKLKEDVGIPKVLTHDTQLAESIAMPNGCDLGNHHQRKHRTLARILSINKFFSSKKSSVLVRRNTEARLRLV